jgi:hypothetical protein
MESLASYPSIQSIYSKHRRTIMRTVRINYNDGNWTLTDINGTDEEIRRYYVGKQFNFGDNDFDQDDDLKTVISVEFISDNRAEEIESEIQVYQDKGFNFVLEPIGNKFRCHYHPEKKSDITSTICDLESAISWFRNRFNERMGN